MAALIAPDITKARRLVVKIGSALLVDREKGLKRAWLSALALDVVEARTTNATTSRAISSGGVATSKRHASSSGVGASSVANCESRSAGGMKCPARRSSRSAMSARSPSRKTKRTGAAARSTSR